MRWMLLLATLAGGCATAEVVMGPDGTQHVNVHCQRQVSVCYRKMAEVCPAGYQVVDASNGFVLVPINGTMAGSPQHDFLIKCGRPTAAAGPTAGR
jgi:hypothetical protein